MQIALKKTLKKVAAVSTSLALAGITVSSALAAGLGDLPSPFGSDMAKNVVVYGSAGSDMAAVNDVLSAVGGGMLSGSGTTYTVGGMNTAPLMASDFETGERNDVAVGTALSTDFGTELDETDAIGLKKMNIPIDIGSDKDYDAHEVIDLESGSAKLTDALEETDEDFGDKTFIKVPSESMSYYVKFEENLDATNNITGASTDDTITFPFLGKNLVITGATATSVTAYSGDKVALKVGDVVKVGDKSVKLDGIDDDSALINVDGEDDSVDEGDRERINGVEIFVDNVFNSDDDVNDKAVLVVQGSAGEAIESFDDGENFVDENKDHYLWEWDLSGLSGTSKDTIVMGVTLNQDLNDPTETFDKKIMDLGLLKENKAFLSEGDYLCLPYRYACLVLEGPANDLTWNDYTFESNKNKDLNLTYLGTGSFTKDIDNAKTLEISAVGVGEDRGLTVVKGLGTFGDIDDAQRVWIYYNGSLAGSNNGVLGNASLAIYYQDSDTSNPIRADLDGSAAIGDFADSIFITNGSRYFARFDNGDYNARMYANITVGNPNTVYFIVGGLNGASNLTFKFVPTSNTTSGITWLGTADGDAATGDFLYGSTDITGYSDSVRRLDGAVVKSPEGNIDNDKVTVAVPNDDEYKFWIKVAKPKSAGSVTPSGSAPKGPSLAMKDSEVGDVASLGKNVITVGGPAVNKVTASLLGLTFPTYGSGVAGLSEGKAMLEMKDVAGGKKALLVYGWEADDTRRAALVVKNHDSFSTQLKDKNSVMVSGTTLTVSGITVA